MGYQREFDFQGVEALRTADLLAIPYDYPGEKTVVSYITDEFTSVCPWSGLPDFAHLEISYIPREKLVELKTLKLYLTSFRNVGILQEHSVNRILKDLVGLLAPVWMRVSARFAPRGGIATEVSAEHGQREDK
ncbi:MAG: preQ(1) synthase [Chloroflexota bacterium]